MVPNGVNVTNAPSSVHPAIARRFSPSRAETRSRLRPLPLPPLRSRLRAPQSPPLRVRPSGRMPDMKLTRAEAKAIAGYLLGEVQPKATPLQPMSSAKPRRRQ